MGIKTYDPGKVVLTFKGVTVTGFHSGTFIKVERDEATWKKEKGAQGDGVRTRNRNKGGKITFTLQGTSPSNSQLSAIALSDEENGDGVGACSVKEVGTNNLAMSHEGWIVKPANLDYADEHMPREWEIDLDALALGVGSPS